MSAASAATLIRERALGVLADRYDLAERFAAFEWLEAILDEKRFMVDVLRALTADLDAGRLEVEVDVTVRALVDARSWEAERRLRRRLADPATRDRILEAVERALDDLADEADL